eukprot:COSAG01_NODE_18691_length_1059_cov_100.007292_1_plen_207_part_10
MHLPATELVGGSARGELLHTDVGLSFWGGVDPLLGTIIDHTHPLHGECITGKVLAVPNGRGSCTGSQVVLELILNGIPPAAMLLRQPDAILSLGVIVAEELFGRSIPIVSLGQDGFDAIAGARYAVVQGSAIIGGSSAEKVDSSLSNGEGQQLPQPSSADALLVASKLVLTDDERSMGKEIHRMKLRLTALNRRQEELVKTMEGAIE